MVVVVVDVVEVVLVDVVLVDARMAKVDAFAFAQRLKDDSRLSCRVIMMLTSGDRPAEQVAVELQGGVHVVEQDIGTAL